MIISQYLYELCYNINFEFVNIFHHIYVIGMFIFTMFITYHTLQPQVFLLLTVVFSFHQTLAPPYHTVLVLRRFLVSPVAHPTLTEPVRKLMIGATVWYFIAQPGTHLYTLYNIIRIIITPANDGQSPYDCQQSIKLLVVVIASISLVALAYTHFQGFKILLGMCKKPKAQEHVINVLNPLGAV